MFGTIATALLVQPALGQPEYDTGTSEVEPGTEEARAYAQHFGVTTDEASSRLEAMEELDPYVNEVLALRGVEGIWADHEGGFRLVVGTVDEEAEAKVRERLPDHVAATLGFVRPDVSASDLDWSLERVAEALEAHLPGQAVAGARLSEGRITIETPDPEAVRQILEDVDLRIEDQRVDVRLGGVVRETANIYAGLDLGSCTSGFAATRLGTRGLLTAGHCGGPFTYGGSTLQRITGVDSGNYDVAFLKDNPHYSQPWGFDPYYDTSTPYYREITWVPATGNLYQGRWVCKYGQTTGYGCGEIVDTTFGCTGGTAFRRVSGSGDLAEGGDSGGPVYLGSGGAAGIITCQYGNDLIFMPATFSSNAISASIVIS